MNALAGFIGTIAAGGGGDPLYSRMTSTSSQDPQIKTYRSHRYGIENVLKRAWTLVHTERKTLHQGQ